FQVRCRDLPDRWPLAWFPGIGPAVQLRQQPQRLLHGREEEGEPLLPLRQSGYLLQRGPAYGSAQAAAEPDSRLPSIIQAAQGQSVLLWTETALRSARSLTKREG